METKKSVHIRINLTSREFEITAEPDFLLEKFGDKIFEYLDIIKSASKKSQAKEEGSVIDATTSGEETPNNFGEYYNKFPKGLSNVDKLLAASYFVQCSTENKMFSIKEASDILINQGIKLTNPSAFNTANVNAKRVFKLNGKNYKVSDAGKEHLTSLIKG